MRHVNAIAAPPFAGTVLSGATFCSRSEIGGSVWTRRDVGMARQIFPMLASIWLVSGAAPDAGATERRFVLSADGLGPIQLDQPIDIETLQEAYPEFDFEIETVEREGMPERQIVAFEAGAQALRVRLLEDRSFDIVAVSPRVTGPFGVRVGAPYRDLTVSGCLRGAEDSPYVHCGSMRTRRLQYLFVIDGERPKPEDAVAALRVY